jgi:hypothetical protein
LAPLIQRAAILLKPGLRKHLEPMMGTLQVVFALELKIQQPILVIFLCHFFKLN